jgi:hypothetical protein
LAGIENRMKSRKNTKASVRIDSDGAYTAGRDNSRLRGSKTDQVKKSMKRDEYMGGKKGLHSDDSRSPKLKYASKGFARKSSIGSKRTSTDEPTFM